MIENNRYFVCTIRIIFILISYICNNDRVQVPNRGLLKKIF